MGQKPFEKNPGVQEDSGNDRRLTPGHKGAGSGADVFFSDFSEPA